MYCIDFFRKFKKDGNFCGLDKSQVSRLTAYLEIVELLMKQHIPEEQIYENLSVRAAEPLITAMPEARTEGLNYVTAQLKEGKKIKTGDTQTSLQSCTCATSEPKAKPVQEKKPEPVKAETSQKKPFAMCYQPGEVKVTDAPVQPSLAQQQAGKAPAQINNGANVTVNPVVINDTYRQSPFKTGAEVKEHQEDPLGIDAPATIRESPTVATPAETDKQKRIRLSEELLDCYSERVRLTVTDILRDHPSWNVSDVFYFGIEALANSKPQRVK
jgi:hypothetical protein